MSTPTTRPPPACGNPRCCVSTGIHEGLTFGSGRLDHNGYWQHPCRPCAKAFDERNPGDEYGPAWPFAVHMADVGNPIERKLTDDEDDESED